MAAAAIRSDGALTITVGPRPPRVEVGADPPAVLTGGSSLLTWHSDDAATCVISPDPGFAVGTSGTGGVTPAGTTTYTITATGPGGTASAQAKVVVREIEVQPQPEGFFGSRYEDLI